MSVLTFPDHAFQCPGERYTIARAVHLGRLAAQDERCRHCTHRHDVGTLPARVVEQLQARWQQTSPDLFDDHGAAGLVGENFDATTVRRLASAFAVLLINRTPELSPSVVVAGDGRPATAELVAAACDGLRWGGCEVIELPSSTTASLLFTQRNYAAQAALLVGNTSARPRGVSVRFYGPQGRRLCASPVASRLSIRELRRHFEQNINRPTRRYGAWRRGSAEQEYLATLSGYFHALRPLRFVLDSASAPLVRYLSQLLDRVGCRVISPTQAAKMPPGECHFTYWVDGDGETCRVHDEAGELIEPDLLLKLLSNLGASSSDPGGGQAAQGDALLQLALLLTVLSQSDRPLSEVAAAGGGGAWLQHSPASAYTNQCP